MVPLYIAEYLNYSRQIAMGLIAMGVGRATGYPLLVNGATLELLRIWEF